MIQYPTDSPNKILAHGFQETRVPRYFIDMAREICRPMMAHNTDTCLLPYIDASLEDYCDHTSPLILGINPNIAFKFDRIFDEIENQYDIDLQRRPLSQEEPIYTAGLSVSDGEYFFTAREVRLWRMDCQYLLRSLVNGCRIAKGLLKEYPHSETPIETRTKFDLVCAKASDINADLSLITDTAPAPEAVTVSEETSTAALLAAIVDCEPIFDEHGVGRYWFYYNSQRDTRYNDWLLRYTAPSSHMPMIRLAEKITRRFLEFSLRFPSATYGIKSSTPKNGNSKNPNKSNTFGKGPPIRRPPPKAEKRKPKAPVTHVEDSDDENDTTDVPHRLPNHKRKPLDRRK